MIQVSSEVDCDVARKKKKQKLNNIEFLKTLWK
jgi:hypothetical protein